MPTFELVSQQEALVKTATGKRAQVLQEYVGFIERLKPGQAGILHTTEGETLNAVRRRLGAAAKLGNKNLVIKRNGDELMFWPGEPMRRRGRSRKDGEVDSYGGLSTVMSRDDRSPYNAEVIKEFRSSGGQVASRPGQKLLLLHTTGAKTGHPRTNPLSYLPGEDCLYVFATKGGSPSHPDWYFNLVANPIVTVEVGTERYEATATTITGPERDGIYATQVEARPVFGDYEGKTTRLIPVVALRGNTT